MILPKGQATAIGQLFSIWKSVPRSLKYCIHCKTLTLGSQHARHTKKCL